MINYFGIENILVILIIVFLFMAYTHDKFSKNVLGHIDKLQNRVNELEERLGIKEK